MDESNLAMDKYVLSHEKMNAKESPFFKKLTRRKSHFEPYEGQHALKRILGVWDLTSLGVAAIIGAGIFSTIGKACFDGGPAVVFLFVITAIASAFSALCYAEFASRIPVSGSAYTYAYATFGELAAWVIGWALVLEYSIGNIAVAQSWSGYFTSLVNQQFLPDNMHIPSWLSCNYFTAKNAFADGLKDHLGYTAWQEAPLIGNMKFLMDLPALCITILITALVYVGVKESRNVSNAMVLLKLAVIIMVIVLGAFYVDTDNWKPFMPNGFGGVISGISAVFFAYIGFDAISTTAEECKNPGRDLPRGMFYSLLICTVLYVLIALVLSGMVSYESLAVSDPLAFVFQMTGHPKISWIIGCSAVVALTGVLLVFQLGQPRIWLSMSRDGLMPKRFSKVHPKFKTPSFATIVTGAVVGIPLFFLSTDFSVDFTSIGTLFAFLLVCAGTLLLPPTQKREGSFNLPHIKGTWLVPLTVGIILALFIIYWNPIHQPANQELKEIAKARFHEVLSVFFLMIAVGMAILTILRKWNAIPVFGVITCCYLLTGMNEESWKAFFIWFAIGLIFYFGYGFKKSKLNKQSLND